MLTVGLSATTIDGAIHLCLLRLSESSLNWEACHRGALDAG